MRNCAASVVGVKLGYIKIKHELHIRSKFEFDDLLLNVSDGLDQRILVEPLST